MQNNFFNLTLGELETLFQGLGKEKFRAGQLFKWVYEKRVEDPEQMSNLAKTFRKEVIELLDFKRPHIVDRQISQDGTQKFLFQVGPHETVESVLIPSDNRLTLCISSEVGCNLGCRFCFTATQKLKRRLKASEIVGQFLAVSDLIKNPQVDSNATLEELEASGQRISNIVFMGMGEPLDNPDEVFKAVEILHSPNGCNLSRKKITVSTSGLVDRIPLVTQARVRLAVSLNGTTDDIRSQLMPINKKFPISVLIEACKKHAYESKDRVTLGYVLIQGLTDSLQDADRLIKLTKGLPCKINIIPFNEHPGSDYRRPSDESVLAFQKRLMDNDCHVLLRKTMGDDIYAACGQLTSKVNELNNNIYSS